jgi:hypothetical protein
MFILRIIRKPQIKTIALLIAKSGDIGFQSAELTSGSRHFMSEHDMETVFTV